MKPTRGKTPKKTPRRPQQNNKARDPVEVYCRLRPASDDQTDLCAEVLSETALLLRPSEAARVNRIGELKETQHTFRFVFPVETSQKTLFDMVALPLVQDVIQGKNGLLFTYGVTGSGKTHTVQGTPADHGLLPRCLDVIFNSIGELQAKRYVFKPDKMNGMDLQTEADAMLERQRKLQQDLLVPPKTPTTPRRNGGDDWQNFPYVADPTKVETVDEDNAYAVFVSFIEIYNNYIYDLLEEAPTSAPSTPRAPFKFQSDDGNGIAPQSKILREDTNHNMYVYGATEVEVKNPEEACEQLIKGQKRRRVAHTQLNMASSRSHSVFLIRVAQSPLDPEGEEVLQDKSQVCVSQLALVDLAGSERTNRTKNTGDRLREASNINASLMVLRTCIEILRENQTSNSNRIVPYRDSKVTHLFKNYFEGEGKVRMVICVNPSACDYEETIHVMRFAELTQEVEITRQKEVRFDTGLTPGRRKANQMFKEALEKFERGEHDGNIVLPGRPGYSLGPPWPCLEMTSASEDVTLQTLLQFLVEREACRRTLCDDLSRKHDAFRSQLLDLEKNNILLRQEMEGLQEQLTGKGKDLERAKKKIENLEYKNEVLRRTAQLYDEEKKEMESELKSKDHQITSRTAESRRLRQTMKAIEQTKDAKWEKECDRRMKQQRLELQNKMWVKDEKLRQLKEIVSSKDGKRRAKSPPPKPTAPPVRLNHRRSRSASGDRWLDHKPVCNLETETVLQPQLKKKMTVSVPDVKNIKKTDKYMLTHQEEDSQGEIETKLIKGDVFKSRAGGHSVQFTDIEVLKQEAPPESRKRSASENIEEEHSGDFTDVETRCAIAIEGHDRRASAKRHKV